MKKSFQKLSREEQENELVTRGILKVELNKFEKKIEKKFVTKKEFNEHADLMSKSFALVMEAFAGIRAELKEMRQEMSSMYGGIRRNEKDIAGLDERVLKLESAQ